MIELLPEWASQGVEGGQPWVQGTVLALLTLVQEDVPAVAGALWAASGSISALTAFLGVFLGIWIGDLLLFFAARTFGVPFLNLPWISRWCDVERRVRGQEWFREKGMWAIFLSRFIPGTRLPTYVAAGLLGQPWLSFVLLTGMAVLLWTSLIFVLVWRLGAAVAGVTPWLGIVLASGLAAGLILRRQRWIALRVIPVSFRRRVGAFCGKWTRWEFWPAWLFYMPVVCWYVWLALRHRGWTLPTAANPGIPAGGMVGESKFDTLRKLQTSSPMFTAPSWLIPGATPLRGLRDRTRELDRILAEGDISFPFIMKPDVGQRGVGVKWIRSREEAMAYLAATPAPLVIQRYIKGPHELGVFYFRDPKAGEGRIFAVTEKIFPSVEGDGIRTLEQLIWEDRRARYVAPTYLKRFSARLGEIPSAGQKIRLVEAGNHAQGCIFRDGSHLISPRMQERLDAITRGVDGFFIGRFDLRYESAEQLQNGEGFWILELNGAASEATSIYDARNSLISAYRTLFRQWELVFAIGRANRERGTQPMTLRELIQNWRRASCWIETYPGAD